MVSAARQSVASCRIASTHKRASVLQCAKSTNHVDMSGCCTFPHNHLCPVRFRYLGSYLCRETVWVLVSKCNLPYLVFTSYQVLGNGSTSAVFVSVRTASLDCGSRSSTGLQSWL
jgi:hypothetical protein